MALNRFLSRLLQRRLLTNQCLWWCHRFLWCCFLGRSGLRCCRFCGSGGPCRRSLRRSGSTGGCGWSRSRFWLCWLDWCRDFSAGGFLNRKDCLPWCGFRRSCSRTGSTTALQHRADLACLGFADRAAVALSRNGQLLSGIQHVFVVQAKVLGQLIDSDFAAAGHSGLRSVRARGARGTTQGGASVHLASAADSLFGFSRVLSSSIALLGT